jgi:hypothetical protein
MPPGGTTRGDKNRKGRSVPAVSQRKHLVLLALPGD